MLTEKLDNGIIISGNLLILNLGRFSFVILPMFFLILVELKASWCSEINILPL